MKKLLLLDFDRTLFSTDFFIENLWRVIAKKYDLNYLDIMAEIPKFYHARGELRYYDFVFHFQDAIGKTVEESIESIRPELANISYQYEDAEKMIQEIGNEFEMRILSFGETWFQNFKMSFSHIASDLPRDIILAAKNDFISSHFANRQGALVDDKRNSDLPKEFTEIWLKRDGDKPKQGSIITINSLTQLPEVLHELY